MQRRLLLDKYTQLPRGVGFVRFSLRTEAQAAIAALNGQVPEGGQQTLSVKVAEDFSRTKQAGAMQQYGKCWWWLRETYGFRILHIMWMQNL